MRIFAYEKPNGTAVGRARLSRRQQQSQKNPKLKKLASDCEVGPGNPTRAPQLFCVGKWNWLEDNLVWTAGSSHTKIQKFILKF